MCMRKTLALTVHHRRAIAEHVQYNQNFSSTHIHVYMRNTYYAYLLDNYARTTNRFGKGCDKM